MTLSQPTQRGLFLSFFLLLLPGLLMAADKSQVQALLIQSGFTEQVKTWPDMIRAEIQQQGEITEDSLDLILSRADSDSLVTRLESSVQTRVASALSEADLASISRWYQSPLGKQITNEEIAAASQQGLQEMQVLGPALRKNDSRVAIMRQLDSLTHTTDNALALHFYSAKAVANAIPGNHANPAPMDKAALRVKIEKRVDLAFLYAYRNLDETRLERYQTFLNSDAAQRFYRAIHEGMTAAFINEIDQWATQLREAMSAVDEE